MRVTKPRQRRNIIHLLPVSGGKHENMQHIMDNAFHRYSVTEPPKLKFCVTLKGLMGTHVYWQGQEPQTVMMMECQDKCLCIEQQERDIDFGNSIRK